MTNLSTKSHWEWLQRKWGLPEVLRGAVEGLLQAEASGSTAYEVELPEKGREWLEERQQTLAGSFPIVLKTTGGRTFLQSRVLHEMECSVVEKLLKLSKQSAGQGSNFQGLLGESSLNGQQRKAVEHALTHCLTIVTGGPGTGKTYTLARILAVFSKQADFKPTRIRLAAPTGKAAQRMKEALLVCAEGLPEQFDRGKIRALAESCSTIHALLGYNRGTGGFRSQPFDDGTVLVLDECSMVDLPLWWALLGLMPENGRLILIGDPHQLESVGQGAVFAEVASADALRAHVIELKESHRFKDCPKLKELAEAMREGNAEKVSRVLGSVLENSQNSTADSDLLWRRRWPRGADDFPEFVKEKWQGIACAEDAQEALARLSGLCLLTAHREGSVGAEVLSLRIQQHFRALKGARFFPIIINKNDPFTGLKNGTVGVLEVPSQVIPCKEITVSNSLENSSAWQERRLGARAYFKVGEGIKEFAASELPDHSLAWAMTIHRSQGSEFEAVVVLVPRGESPLATRELLYTAITRARKQVLVCGELDDIKKAVRDSMPRCTLLGCLFQESIKELNVGIDGEIWSEIGVRLG